MDLKFRSDILGRSVLFMGYSFSDINIRIIWFKLMQMMRDVPTKDRLPSYIVRLDSNPVLEALFADVGLQTIVLDPKGEAKTVQEQADVLSDFLANLSAAASPAGHIPGTDTAMFMSKRLLTSLAQRWSNPRSAASVSDAEVLTSALKRQVPESLKNDALALLEALCGDSAYLSFQFTAEITSWAHNLWGPLDQVTGLISRALMENYMREQLLVDERIDWEKVWSGHLPDDIAHSILRGAERELPYHESQQLLDNDLAFYVDLLARLAKGTLTSNTDVQMEAQALLDRAAKVYPAAKKYKPKSDRSPEPTTLIREISARERKLAEEAKKDDEDSDVDDVGQPSG